MAGLDYLAELARWRQDQPMWHTGYALGRNFFRSHPQRTTREREGIAAALSWFYRWSSTLGTDSIAREEGFLLDDLLGWLDDRYELLLMRGMSRVLRDERVFSYHSAAAFLALSCAVGIAAPQPAEAISDEAEVPDSEASASP